MTLNKSNLYLGMSNNDNNNYSDYYEESSTDEETTAPGSVSGTAATSLPPQSSSSAGPSSSSGARTSSSAPASSGSQAGTSGGGSFVAFLAPRTSGPFPQAPSTISQGVLESPGDQSFMGLFTHRDIDRLENWASLTSSLQGTPGFSVSGPPGPNALTSFLRANWGARWDQTLLSSLGEIVVFQLRAYISGYSQLTSFERGQWTRLYSLWTMGERAAQLRRLAEKGGFLEIE